MSSVTIKSYHKEREGEILSGYPFLFPAVEMKRQEIITTLKGKEFTVA